MRLQRKNPEQRQPESTTARCNALSSSGNPTSSTGGTTWVPKARTDIEVYLRTAVSVDPQGWAQFGHVKMPDYRWGIFLNQGEARSQDPLW
jgi:hypothetical protein